MFGCGKVLFGIMSITHGVRKPKFEDKASITKYMKKYKLDTVDVVRIANNSIVFWQEQSTATRIYNKDGKLVFKTPEDGCSAPQVFLKIYKNASQSRRDSMVIKCNNEDISLYTSNLCTLDNKPLNIQALDNDLIAFQTYNAFMGRISKVNINEMKEIYNESGLKVRDIKVNMDIRKEWRDSLMKTGQKQISTKEKK